VVLTLCVMYDACYFFADPFAVFSHALVEMNISSSPAEGTGSVQLSEQGSKEGPLVLQSTSRSSATMCSLGVVGGPPATQDRDKPEGDAAWVVEKPVSMIDSRRDYISQHLDNAVVSKLDHLQTDYEVRIAQCQWDMLQKIHLQYDGDEHL
jgi:hypothetical protein